MIIRNFYKIVFILFAGLLLTSHPGICANSKFLEIIKVSDNVYVFKPKIDWVHSNCVAVIGSESILIVDTFIQSNYADEAIRLLKGISNLPVQYVVNTHWHNDHVMGNYAFKKAFPECQIVMHDSTYVYMAKNITKAIENEEQSMKSDIESTEKELAEGKRSNGYHLTPAIAAFWKWTIDETKEYQKNYKPNKLVNGEILFSNTLTLNLGTEKVVLMHAEDDGHSKGDVIVWIEDKKVLITGDIIVGPTPYATGSNITGMVRSIQKVIDMNPSTIIPGHGVILHDLSYPKLLLELFTEMSMKSQEAVLQKIPVKEAMDGKVVVPKDLAFKFTKGDEVKEMALHAWFTRWIVYNTYKNSGALPAKKS
jgi:glyoxylase-like metal-dependent hydrolase (beta-lactamase superfamily II)